MFQPPRVSRRSGRRSSCDGEPADGPLEELAAAVARRRRRGAGHRRRSRRRRRRSSARGTRAGRLLDQRRDAAGARCSARRRGRSPSGSRRSARAARWATELERAEVAGPGFLNLCCPTPGTGARCARCSTPASGSAPAGPSRRERMLIEFVSANPTGPLVAASGRHAAYGDALARILEHHGHSVTREYYFNDAGNQIRLLGESVQARARGEEVPEGGYQGDYVADLAARDSRAPRRPTSTSWPRSAVEHAAGADQGDARALRRALRRVLQRADAARGVAEPARAGARRCSSRPATCTAPRARCGCARRRFGDDKDRVVRALERRADLPRRATSRTCRTSASAASSAS